jgi:hypothetical protein
MESDAASEKDDAPKAEPRAQVAAKRAGLALGGIAKNYAAAPSEAKPQSEDPDAVVRTGPGLCWY